MSYGIIRPPRKMQRVRFSKQEYAEYLKSPEWLWLRAQVLRGPETQCAFCAKKATQVHHLAYRNITDVRKEHLRPVCDPCHTRIHKLVKMGVISLNSWQSGYWLFTRTSRALRKFKAYCRKSAINPPLAKRILKSTCTRHIAGVLKVSIYCEGDILGMKISTAQRMRVIKLLRHPARTAAISKRQVPPPPRSQHY